MLKISMCVVNHVKNVKNVYVNHVENQAENNVEVQKKSIQFFSWNLHNFLIWYIFQVMRS